MSIKAISLLFTVIFLAGCQENVKKSDNTGAVTKQAEAAVAAPKAKAVVQTSEVKKKAAPSAYEILTNQLIEKGQRALAANHLLTPEDNNANLYFQTVLGRDPGNYQATLGVAAIVDQYNQWALIAAQQANYKAAHKYLDDARSVNPEDATIAATKARIEGLQRQRKLSSSAAQQNASVQENVSTPHVTAAEAAKEAIKKGHYFLPHDLFSLSDEEILQHLQPIIDKIAQDKNEIAIYWPNDKNARLLYQIINSRVSEFRVRAMIYHRSDYMVKLQKN